jgi:hypothetical protein
MEQQQGRSGGICAGLENVMVRKGHARDYVSGGRCASIAAR